MSFQRISACSIPNANCNPIVTRESNDPGESEQLALNTVTDDSFIPLEDCKCPICLDYFIDVVETRCHHRFCNFCLENWLRVSFHRRCPTCRSVLSQGSLQVKADLQNIINSSIRPVLSDDIVRERLQVRLERQAQVERFTADREQTQALLARITSSRPRTRARQMRHSRRFGADENGARETAPAFISQHIMNWWDVNNPTTTVSHEATRRTEPSHFQRETDVDELPFGWFRQLRDRNDDNGDLAPRDDQRSHHRRASSSFDQSYHENLMEEYNYHLSRVNSAHTRIREAYRDFNYHNGRMEEILQEHRSFFSGVRVPENNVTGGTDENNRVSYEDYENLLGAEMGELLDNSPAAQVLFGRFPTENTQVSTGHSHNFPNGLRPLTLFGPPSIDYNNNYTGRNVQGNSRRYPPGPVPQRANVLDMEHEIRNRRNQLNHLSSLIRQCPWNNSDSRYSRGELSGIATESFSSQPAPVTTPMQFVQQSEPEFMTRHDWARQSTGQHQIMVERLSGVNGNAPPPSSRRMRRRLARYNSFRAGVRNSDDPTSNSLHPAQNSFSENTLQPTSNTVGDVDISNVDTGAFSDIGISNSPTNAQSRPNNEGTNANHVTDIEPDYHSVVPPSVGWIVNASSESDEEEQVREVSRRCTRASNRSPQNTPRSTSVTTRRGFRRALRFPRRRLDVFNSDTNDGSTATAPASSSSNTNTNISVMGSQNVELSNDEVFNDRIVTSVDDGNNFVGVTENQVPEQTFHNNSENSEGHGMDRAMRNISSMNNYLKTLCDTFKTR